VVAPSQYDELYFSDGMFLVYRATGSQRGITVTVHSIVGA
jgi:hypothetical protein